MWATWLKSARGLSLLLPALFTACGGGGGGNGNGGGAAPPLVYSGNTNAAVITASNSARLVSDVIGSGDTPSIIIGNAVAGGEVARLSPRAVRAFRGALVQAKQANVTERITPTAIPVDSTDPCDSGSVRTFGQLNNNGTGTLMVTFTDCRIGGQTLTGPATLRVDAFDIPLAVATDATFEFARLTLRGTGTSADVGGSFRVQLNIGTNTETLTTNFVSLDNNTGRMTRSENLVFVRAGNVFPTAFTETMNGRVFDSVHGFVDVTTISPLVFDSANPLLPDSGQILLTGASAGAGNGSVLVTALSPTMARLALDLDGDGVRENAATLKWIDLSGPVGANLADSDGDGLHDSWEAANGLNPNDAADAALNSDGDRASNLTEYLAGTDPNNGNSIPDVSLTSVSAGGEHTCGLTSDGKAYCWGLGTNGQLGNGGTASSQTPVPVAGGLTFKSISAGGGAFVGHSCGITTGGAAYCWGYGGWGQLGHGMQSGSSVPVPVSGGLSFTSVSAGRIHTCAIAAGGAAYCWGQGGFGQLGDGTPVNNDSATPVPVSGGISFAAVSAGVGHSCGVAPNGVAYCWGTGQSGQLGNGTTNQSSAPVEVSGGGVFVSVSAGASHSCGVTSSGAAYCWGNNLDGQLGNGTFVSSSVPMAVSGALTFASLSAREGHACGNSASGALFCWGANGRGQLGNQSAGISSPTPTRVVGVVAFAGVSAGEYHTCGQSVNDRLYCWGWNLEGQLGTGTAFDSLAPVRVTAPL